MIKLLGHGLVIMVSIILSFSCSSTSSEGKEAHGDQSDKTDEWVMLFDGVSLDGWRTVGSDTVFSAYWKVEDNILKKIDRGKVPARADGQPQKGGDLITIQTFDNYELSWEWALFEDGNSGLKYNVSEEMSMENGSKHSAIGFEYQMLDDRSEKYGDLKSAQFSGSLYDLLPAENVKLKPNGKWNESRIRIDGDKVTHWLNGEKVLSYSFGSSELKTAYEDSKFAKIPGFINKRNAHIVLQDHITEAWFRNIKLKNL